MSISVEELEKVCQPVAEWLRKNSDQYIGVHITADHAELVTDVAGVPLKTAADEKEMEK